jgi:hypothetical protein
MPFDRGFTDVEVLGAETKYDIHFPDDLREFLNIVLAFRASKAFFYGA